MDELKNLPMNLPALGGSGGNDTSGHESSRDDTSGHDVTIVLDSCSSTWYFQPGRMRYRRSLKGLAIPGVRTAWRPYFGLRFDGALNEFVVFLNPAGHEDAAIVVPPARERRLRELRSRHAGSHRNGGQDSEKLSVADIRHS